MGRMWRPSIEVESARGIREVDLVTHHLMNRVIFIDDEITSELANEFVSQLLFLESVSNEPITIYINSPGGEINAGMVIYDAIQGSDCEINLVAMGMAASMAAVIFASGKKGHRYILKHSKVMIHEPLIRNGLGGSATSIKNISESILKTRQLMNEILAQHTGKTVEEIEEATNFDNYMTAKEAIEFGLCDSITEKIRL